MRYQATGTFDVEERSTENMWYQITVKFRGEVVDVFLKPTMRKAKLAFEHAGYTAKAPAR